MSNEINQQFLDVLHCPLGLSQELDEAATKLVLVSGSWLVCEATGMKYPIIEGIPVLLIEEGEKWVKTAVADLPVPPPTA